MASAVARAYNGGLGAKPPARVQGAEPPVGGQAGEAPLKLKTFFHLHIQQKRQICHIFCLFPVFCTCKRELFARETDIKHRDARDGKFYPCAVLTMVKTPVKTGLGKTPKTHVLPT